MNMHMYSFLREFADSWALISLFAIFVGIAFWAWRPGSRAAHDAAARSIFQYETKPASGPVRADGPEKGA
jgi:cytochrome c oxidase cbb3-type subunit IV